MKHSLIALLSFLSFILMSCESRPYAITDKEYFTNGKVSVLVHHNNYYVGRVSGVEIIQHGERILTNGGLTMRSCDVPDLLGIPAPVKGERHIDVKNSTIQAQCSYPGIDLPYAILVENRGEAFHLSLLLDKPLPDSLAGKMDFIVELYPEMYKGKSFYMNGDAGIFPHQFNGKMNPVTESTYVIEPLATGNKLVVAPEMPLYSLQIESAESPFDLVDARGIHEHKWFVVRGVVPSGKTGKVMEWIITPNSDASWLREPRIAYSQIGYHPKQRKVAYVELDSLDRKRKELQLFRLLPDGKKEKIKTSTTDEWGRYMCYDYLSMDFSDVTEDGLYQLVYGEEASLPFPIKKEVYAEVWQPSIETFLAVQMCHMGVKDRIRNWHALCHNDDAMVAHECESFILGYEQKKESDTPYASGQHVPGLNVGGWHDAGDNQVAQESVAGVVYYLSLAYESFNPATDQTTINQQTKQVLLHQPDGKNDFQQQIEHGVLNMLVGFRIAGHAFISTICSSWNENLEIGAPSDNSDGIVGNADDRFIFTNRGKANNLNSAMVFAAASRALRGYNDALANECLSTALKVWETEKNAPDVFIGGSYMFNNSNIAKINAAVELFITTGDKEYLQFLSDALPKIHDGELIFTSGNLCRAAVMEKSGEFTDALGERLTTWKEWHYTQFDENPFALPQMHEMFGTLAYKLTTAFNHYFRHIAYPDLFDADLIYRTLHYTFGCHSVPDRTFVSGVGIRSLTPGFGFNRSDFSYIPGGVTCGGTVRVMPDYPEFKENDPYLWLQTEYTVGASASYIFCVLAAESLLNE